MKHQMDDKLFRMYFVPIHLIRQALVDMKSEHYCYVRDVFYLKEDRMFAVCVVFNVYSPFLEKEFNRKWESDGVR